MRQLSLITTTILLLGIQFANAQDIFELHGFNKNPLTLSNGHYNEFFNNDEIVQIGTIMLNTKTNQIVAFVEEDTAKARYLAELPSRWLTSDPLAAKYPQFSPYVYAANDPILYIDPDGKEIIIGNNTSRALTNLAMIAITNKGRVEIDQLINSPLKYTLNSVFWTTSSCYDGYGEQGPARSIYYVGSPWMPRIQGGSTSSEVIMGHELNHAFDHDNGENIRNSEARETSSVNFENYMRSVYGELPLRERYSGPGFTHTFSQNEMSYNSSNEKITGFQQLNEMSYLGASIMGFSYNKSENGGKAQTNYILSTKTESGNYIYAIYKTKEEYDQVVKYINEQNKKKEDEKK